VAPSTGFVSFFLDFAVSTFPNPPPNLVANAAQARGAELDEVNLTDIAATINANRCANVLPAIDVYFNAVAVATGQRDSLL
jgi:hypothetical protein